MVDTSKGDELMTTRVFQVQLTDAMADDVNAAGSWSAVSWGKVYMDLTMGMVDDFDALARTIEKAKAFGLITETRVIETNDLDEVFAIGNGYGDETKQTRLTRAKSISVGDILIKNSEVDGGTGYIVARFGFDELSADVTKLVTE
jgi:hypothetical protein